ncbi:MAG: helix-turn-helix transcriptional regulator [Pseudomonadota bacterium]
MSAPPVRPKTPVRPASAEPKTSAPGKRIRRDGARVDADAAFLQRVGERLRTARARRGMSRKVLAAASGVSERYLADLERGAGNASLVILRHVAGAMNMGIDALIADGPEPSAEMALAIAALEKVPADALPQARAMLRAMASDAEGSAALTPLEARGGRLALIGLRGAGKTTLGARVAAARGVPFIELDREIERASGMELAEVFELHGQSAFRRFERACLSAAIARYDDAVIATGGSIVTEVETYDLLLSHCLTVWLKASPRDHMLRVKAQGDLRPMAMSGQAMADLNAILDSRLQLYARADTSVDTSALDEDAALASLLALYDAT